MPKRIPALMRPISRPPESAPRASSAARGYGPAWRRTRAAFLASHRFCATCQANGRATAATEVDHLLSLTSGGTNDWANLVPLCKPCHSKKTVAVDGGLGRPRGTGGVGGHFV
jgi:5-methylcytosine-specific restriction enzyme A